jgi:hypothetical protein
MLQAQRQRRCWRQPQAVTNEALTGDVGAQAYTSTTVLMLLAVAVLSVCCICCHTTPAAMLPWQGRDVHRIFCQQG